jgi:hypothetical protein
MFKANKTTTKTSFKTVTETTNFENGPLASVSLKTAIAEAGLRAIDNVAINDPTAHARKYFRRRRKKEESSSSPPSSSESFRFISSKNSTRSETFPTVNAVKTVIHVNKAIEIVQTIIFLASPLRSLALNSAPADTPMTDKHALSTNHKDSRTTKGVSTFKNYIE